jgi:hypothetical protein
MQLWAQPAEMLIVGVLERQGRDEGLSTADFLIVLLIISIKQNDNGFFT